MGKVSDLTAATALTDDDVLYVIDGSTSKKITAANAATYFGGGDTITISGSNLAALDAAITAASTGDTVVGVPGTTYTHNALWTINKAGITVDMTGCIILASVEAASAVVIDANDVTLIGGTWRCTTSTRGGDLEDHKIVLDGCSGAVVRQVRVESSHAVGIFCFGATDFLLEDCTVIGTQADTIHMTATCVRGVVLRARCYRGGDDGVAVISYTGDTTPCTDIQIIDPVVWDQTGGRGVTVVGGQRVRIVNPDIRRSSGGGIYIANETGAFNSLATSDVDVDGGRLVACNTDVAVDHGSVIIYTGINGSAVSGIRVRGTEIIDPGLAPSGSSAVQVKHGGTTGTTSTVVLGDSDSPIRVSGLYYGTSSVDGGLTVSSNIERSTNAVPGDFLLWGAATWNPASLTNGSTASTTVTVTGAALGDPVIGCALTTIDESGWDWKADVTAANTVSVVLTNNTGGTIDLASGTLTVQVLKA